MGSECASGEQRASLPTRSLEAAGASGAALGCAEAETPTLGSSAPTWPEPAPQGANSLRCFCTGECCSPGLQRSSKNNSVAASYHSCPKVCRLSCGPLWRKWRKGSVCPQTPGRMEKGLQTQGTCSCPGHCFSSGPVMSWQGFIKKLRSVASENRVVLYLSF